MSDPRNFDDGHDEWGGTLRTRIKGYDSPFSEIGPQGEDHSTGGDELVEVLVTLHPYAPRLVPFLDLLNQDRYWINRAKERVDVGSIDARYAANILRMIERFSYHLHRTAVVCGILSLEAIQGEIAHWDAETAVDELDGMDPRAWFEGLPLVRRLRSIS